MRPETFLFLALAACANAPAGTPASVRDRLETDETQLLIATGDSSGSITAQRRSSEGWVAGTVALAVKNGELVVGADARGSITIDHLAVDLGPIEIPRTVLGYDARLTDVHLEARKPAGVVTKWTGDDEARATAEVELQLSWSLTVDGKTTPLGAPRLPAVPIELDFTGDGASVRVEARAAATGMFWSWADLVKLEDLNLVPAAATVNP
jgi:hypothetical protein